MSKVVPSEEISLANKEVRQGSIGSRSHMPSGNASGSGHSCGPHEHFTTNKKAKIGKKAAEIGVSAFPLSFLQDSILLMNGAE